MSVNVRIFARADLHADLRRIVPSATFAEVAKRGSLLEAVASTQQVVGIVDAAFSRGLTITVSEIYQAIQCGVVVLGCHGIAALRAVELRHLGMIGIGATFERVARSRCFDDGRIASEPGRRRDAIAMAKRIAALLEKAARQSY